MFRNILTDKYNKVVNEDLKETIPLLWFVHARRCKGSALYNGIINDIGRRIKAYAKGAGNRAIFEDDEIPPKLGCLSSISNRRNGKCFYE